MALRAGGGKNIIVQTFLVRQIMLCKCFAYVLRSCDCNARMEDRRWRMETGTFKSRAPGATIRRRNRLSLNVPPAFSRLSGGQGGTCIGVSAYRRIGAGNRFARGLSVYWVFVRFGKPTRVAQFALLRFTSLYFAWQGGPPSPLGSYRRIGVSEYRRSRETPFYAFSRLPTLRWRREAKIGANPPGRRCSSNAANGRSPLLGFWGENIFTGWMERANRRGAFLNRKVSGMSAGTPTLPMNRNVSGTLALTPTLSPGRGRRVGAAGGSGVQCASVHLGEFFPQEREKNWRVQPNRFRRRK